MSRSADKDLELLGSALRRVPDYIGYVCTEDLEQLDDWLTEAAAAVHAVRLIRTRPARRTEQDGGIPNDAITSADLAAAHAGGNAEDCPRCTGRRDLPYPFICPGTDTPGGTRG